MIRDIFALCVTLKGLVICIYTTHGHVTHCSHRTFILVTPIVLMQISKPLRFIDMVISKPYSSMNRLHYHMNIAVRFTTYHINALVKVYLSTYERKKRSGS